jgi:gliding motility-associated-like protein
MNLLNQNLPYPIELDAGAGFASYWWNNGDITQTSWANTQGWYLAQVESVEGCIGEDSSYVFFSTPAELINVYFPNAFTPNGDGLNDEFKVIISSPNIEAFSMSVFNRWGAIIFHTNDISLGWDGTYQGKMCTPGSYVFKISYNTSINSNTQPEAKIGTVMLVN